MEIICYERINKQGRLTKYAKFNDIEFMIAKYSKYYRNNKYGKLHNYIYCYYNNIDKIPDGYVIHHIDHNPENNNIENLKLMTKKEHSIYHSKSNITLQKKSESMKGKNTGKRLSEETKNKISKKLKGRRSPNYGNTFSEETRKKLSEAKKGKNNSFYGKHHSEETRKKLSEARKGKKPSTYVDIPKETLLLIKELRNNGLTYKKIAEETGYTMAIVISRLKSME